jgi:hypothetical protein
MNGESALLVSCVHGRLFQIVPLPHPAARGSRSGAADRFSFGSDGQTQADDLSLLEYVVYVPVPTVQVPTVRTVLVPSVFEDFLCFLVGFLDPLPCLSLGRLTT